MDESSRLLKAFSNFCCACLWVMILASCTKKYKRGDFMIIVKERQYPLPGGGRFHRYTITTYDILYKGKEIDWSKQIPNAEKPEAQDFYSPEANPSALLAVVANDFYLLRPAGDNIVISRIGEGAYKSTRYKRQGYFELLNKGLFFHQPGRLINLETLQHDTLAAPPAGRLLVASNDASTIVYVDGMFDGLPYSYPEISSKAKLESYRRYYQNRFSYHLTVAYRSTFRIIGWDVRDGKTHHYRYTDTAYWNALNTYGGRQSFLFREAFDSSFVFGLFRWVRDSAGTLHLIPKNTSLTDIKFEVDGVDSLCVNKKEVKNQTFW